MSVKQHVKNHLWIIPALLAQACAFAALLAWPQLAAAHGGVVAEEDTCLLQMGFLQAHFTLHQPESRGSEEFCEDLPDIGSSLFVVEYRRATHKMNQIDEFRQNARTWLHDKSLSPAAPGTSNSTSSPSACWGCRIEVA